MSLFKHCIQIWPFFMPETITFLCGKMKEDPGNTKFPVIYIVSTQQREQMNNQL